MYKHGSLLALFLFLRYVHNSREQICGAPHAVRNGNPQRTIPFFVRSNKQLCCECARNAREGLTA